MPKKGRVFSGARPTGRQHLGNYLGAIQNYVALQQDYDCIYCIVDVHALTTVETTQDLKQNTFEMTVDWLAAGIRPEESILFVQSHVPEVLELHTYLSMVTQIGKLTDLPTFKEKVAQQPENVNYGLLGYPILMTADIVLYKSDVVPVGVDQAPHLEFAREIVRSFNYRYKTKVLIEPQVKHTEVLKSDSLDHGNIVCASALHCKALKDSSGASDGMRGCSLFSDTRVIIFNAAPTPAPAAQDPRMSGSRRFPNRPTARFIEI